MIFFYSTGGALMSLIEIKSVTQDVAGEVCTDREASEWYGGRWFVCESMTRTAAAWIVKMMGGYLMPDMRVPPARQLREGKQIGKYGKIEISSTRRHVDVPEGWSQWVENGVWFTAPIVDPRRFGGHDYDDGGYEEGIRDCRCGCYMLSGSSAGPVDPFGPCPLNPEF